jgi:hypothetical protein
MLARCRLGSVTFCGKARSPTLRTEKKMNSSDRTSVFASFRIAGTAALTVAAMCGNAYAQAVMPSKSMCANAGANGMEPVGDREGHAVQVSHGTCRLVGGPLDGAVMATNTIWEHDKGAAKALSGDGVIRKPGAMAAYRLSSGTFAFVMKDGKVAGWTASGKAMYTMATGTAAALAGKSFSWTAQPTGASEYVIESVLD